VTAGKRLDQILAKHLADLSRSHLQKLIRAGQVRAGGRTLVEPSARIKRGDVLTIQLPEPEPAKPAAEPIALAIVYEDEHVLVLDKPAGMVVHPAAGHASGTLVNALIAHCGDSLAGIGGVKRPGIVHRLDKDTSGLLVVAKTDFAYRGLQKQFSSHGADGALTRVYDAIVWGDMDVSRGRIDAPLARSTANRTKISVVRPPAGRSAVTNYEVTARYRNTEGRPIACRLDVRLETGRTHQIRVHMAYIGHPLLGDRTYGAGHAASARLLGARARAALVALGRQALHAKHLGFLHPASGRQLAFDSPLPADLARLERTLAASK
jgi:23S rRNA pseudouridine1911/1915/1917 synthase